MDELDFVMPPSGFKRLFYDIETSYCVGSFWRPSYKMSLGHHNIIFDSAIICICWKWEGQKKVYSAEWDEGDDKALLIKFMEAAMKADEIVAHNGDRFDEPWVRTRCMANGIDCPPKFQTYDTLKKARKYFKLPSNTLDFIGKRYLGEGKSPMAFEDWNLIIKPLIPKFCGFEIEMPKSYHKAMDKMTKYCKKDVRLLERAFHKLQPYVEHNQHAGSAAGYGRYSCADCGNDSPNLDKIYYTKAGIPRYSLRCPDLKCRKSWTVSSFVWKQKLEADYKVKMARAEINGG